MDPTAFQAELVHVGHRIGWGLLASAAMAVAAWKVRALTIGGATVSMLMGAAIFSLGGFEGWLMYLAASAVAMTCWRVGQRRRRPTPASHGAGSAVAGSAIGLVGAFLMAAIDANAAGALILTAAVAAWASDAMAFEFEEGYGTGAGAVAGLVTSVALAGLFALAFSTMRSLAPLIVAGAAGGWLSHRVFADRSRKSGLLNEDVLLFLNTLASAAIAYGGMIITS